MGLRGGLNMAIDKQITAPNGNLTSLKQDPAHLLAISFHDKVIGLYLFPSSERVRINFAKPQAIIKQLKSKVVPVFN